MGKPAPRPKAGALVGELHSLIALQEKNYREYLLVLARETEAAANGDDDRLDLCRRMEAAGREKIVGAERSLRALERELEKAPAGAEERAGLAAARASLEPLRREALAANAAVQRVLRDKMEAVKKELDAVGRTLRRLAGGSGYNRPTGDDPLFIDVYS